MINNNVKRINLLFAVLLIVSVITGVYSILTEGQAVLHSDTATATLLAQAQLKYHTLFPKSWCYGNGEIWLITTNLFTLPFSALMKNQSLARMAGSAVWVLIAVLAIYLCTRFLMKSKSWLISIPIFLLFTVSQYDHILYQASYIGVIVWLMLSIWFSYEMFYGEKPKKYVITYLISTLTIFLGTIRYAGEITIPIIGTIILMKYLETSQSDYDIAVIVKDLFQKIFVICIPAVVGHLIYKRICETCTMINTGTNRIEFSTGMENCLDNIWNAVKDMCGSFGFAFPTALFSTWGIRNLLSIVVCIIILFIIPVLQYKNFKNESKEIRYFLLFVLIHNLEMLMLYMVFSKSNSRYLLSSVFLLEMVSARYIYEYLIKKTDLNQLIVVCSYTLIILVYIVSLTYPNRSWKSEVQEKKEFCRELTDRGLTKGYGEFWHVYNKEVYSDLSLKFGAIFVEDGISPFYWLVDSNTFIPEKGIDTFLLLDNTGNRKYNRIAKQQFGPTKDEFELNSGRDRYYIYVWDYDIAEKFNAPKSWDKIKEPDK